MNSRQGALLRALLEASDYRTSADYARRFGCSDRTIRTDVKALNSFFEHEGLATRVGRQRGAGLRLALAPGEEKLVRFTITRQMLESFDPEYGIWACESGLYRILVGNSSDQISCSADLRVKSRSIYDYSPRTCLKKLYDDPRSRAMLIETIHAVGLDENILADELYYRKFRPIGVVLQNLPNADPKRKEQSYQLFYQNIAKLDLTDC